MMKIIFLLFLLLISWATWPGDIRRLGALPIGYQEAMMGNTGIALPGSLGNALINPGALVFTPDRQDFSISGLILQKINLPNFGVKIEDSSENQVAPTMTGSVVSLTPSDTFSCFIFTPTSFVLRGTMSGGIDFEASLKSMVLGTAYSRKLSDQWSLGLNLCYTMSTNRLSVIYRAFVQDGAANDSLTTFQYKEKINDFSLTLGTYYQISDFVSLGFKISPPGKTVSADGEWSQSSMVSGQALQDTKGHYHPSGTQPWTMGLGFRFELTSNFHLLSDFDLNSAYSYSSETSGRQVDKYSYGVSYHLGGGLKLRLTEKVTFFSGGSYYSGHPNKYQSRGMSMGESISRNVSTGFTFKRNYSEFSLGGFHASSDTKDLTKIYGILLMSKFSL